MFGVPRSRGSEGEPPKGGTKVPSFFQQSPNGLGEAYPPVFGVGLRILWETKRRSRNVPSVALSKVIPCAAKPTRHL